MCASYWDVSVYDTPYDADLKRNNNWEKSRETQITLPCAKEVIIIHEECIVSTGIPNVRQMWVV